MSDKHSRRDFLVRSGSILALGLIAPPWLSRIAHGQVKAMAKGHSPLSDNILVVCQLSGGNDGLNTIIPYTDKLYYNHRPELAVPEAQQIPLTESLALHPALAPLKPLWDGGEMSVINGVGYPNPDRSHFRSMQIWQTGDPADHEQYGWLGRYLDSQSAGSANPLLALGLGYERSEALAARQTSVPVFASLADVNSLLGSLDAERAMRAMQSPDSPDRGVAFASRATQTALDAMAQLRLKLGGYNSTFEYADDEFGKGFKQIAQLIAISAGTRVIYFSTGGFDTHANQADSHSTLLGGFADAASTFMAEMKAIGAEKKVTLLVFSEFGRRLSENGSKGTDHGAAAPMLLLGGSLKGGAYGLYPSLSDLNDGDLKHSTDFRRVYSSVLRDWMHADAESILGADFGHMELFSKA